MRSAPEGPAALILIIIGHLRAQIAAAGVDHQKQTAVLCPVHFNKMVSAAQRADAVRGPAEIDPLRTAQLGQIDLCIQPMDLAAHLVSAGDLPADQCVQFVKVDLPLRKLHRLHAAADIDPDHTGDDLIPDGHGGTDGAAFPRVYVGHDAYSAPGKLLLIAHRPDLLFRRLLQFGGIANGGIVQALNLNHSLFPSFALIAVKQQRSSVGAFHD